MADRQTHPNGDPEQKHALVVIFLRGGADGLNMVVPVEDDDYYRARPLISISKKDALPLDGFFGLNPNLGALKRAYDDGALAIVHGAGSEDDTRSHFEAQDTMEHGGPVAGGWLGRYLRYRPHAGVSPLSAVAIGKARPESLRGAPASVAMESLGTFSLGGMESEFVAALKTLYAGERNPLGRAGSQALVGLKKVEQLRQTEYRPAHGAQYPQDSFSSGLRLIAQLIKSQVGLEAVSLDLPGWDSHFATKTLMDPMMRRLAGGLSAFYRDMGGAMVQSTVVVMTEFGRRVYQNASFGSDHGRGGVMFVLGGAVAGGRIINAWAGLGKENLEGPGDLPVTHNYRDVLAPILARHGGIDDMGVVFPGFDLNPLDLYS